MMNPLRSPVLALTLLLAATPTIGAPFGEHVQFRGNLDHSRRQFEQTGRGNVVFLGGSITEMNGYRPMVSEILQRRFPQTAFRFTNAGLSSTTSTTGAFRLARDVLAHGPVDLLFVEFAVNDDQDGHHTRVDCIRGLEGIVRHARQANPQVDIIVTFFLNEGMLQTLQSGQTPLTIEAHEAVARHYGLPAIHLAREVAAQITAGTLTWKTYGGVHPAPAGNTIAAQMIDELFTRAWTAPLPSPAPSAPAAALVAPLEPLNYSAGRFIDLRLAVVKSGWSLGVPEWKALPGGKRERYVALPMLCATEPGAELTLAFEGTAAGAFIVAGPDAGMVEVTIDGGPVRKLDLFHSYSKGLHYPCTVMFGTDLRPGRHELRLRIGDETSSSGHAMRIMEFAAN